jgi:hypothetical protein
MISDNDKLYAEEITKRRSTVIDNRLYRIYSKKAKKQNSREARQ